MRSAILALLLAPLAACQPDLPNALSTTPPAGSVSLRLEPPAAIDRAPRVVRIHLAADVPLDPEQVLFARGELGPAHLRELQHHQLSKALTDRVVATMVWHDAQEPGAIVVAPTVTLEPDAMYGLAYADPPLLATLHVDASSAVALVQRVWPPPDEAAPKPFAVWCGDGAPGSMDVPCALAPGGPAGAIRSGAAGDIGPACLRFEPSDAQPDALGAWLSPPLVGAASEEPVALEPLPIVVDDVAVPAAMPASCAAGEVAFGLGCVVVQDDRLLGRSPAEPILWAIRQLGAPDPVEAVFAAGAGDPFVIAPLAPLSPVVFDVVAIDRGGRTVQSPFVTMTHAPMPHPILNEVLANPLGAEPSQEWVEIVNDGSVSAQLGNYILKDLAGETALPPVLLPPHAFALIVNETFVEHDGVDPPPAPGTLLVRVPKLGKNGLANAGEPLALAHRLGGIVSGFPAIPKPNSGQSVARKQPSAPDGAAASFALSEPSPGRDNAEGLL